MQQLAQQRHLEELAPVERERIQSEQRQQVRGSGLRDLSVMVLRFAALRV